MLEETFEGETSPERHSGRESTRKSSSSSKADDSEFKRGLSYSTSGGSSSGPRTSMGCLLRSTLCLHRRQTKRFQRNRQCFSDGDPQGSSVRDRNARRSDPTGGSTVRVRPASASPPPASGKWIRPGFATLPLPVSPTTASFDEELLMGNGNRSPDDFVFFSDEDQEGGDGINYKSCSLKWFGEKKCFKYWRNPALRFFSLCFAAWRQYVTNKTLRARLQLRSVAQADTTGFG